MPEAQRAGVTRLRSHSWVELQSLCSTPLYLTAVSSSWTRSLTLRKGSEVQKAWRVVGPKPQGSVLGFFFLSFFGYPSHGVTKSALPGRSERVSELSLDYSASAFPKGTRANWGQGRGKDRDRQTPSPQPSSIPAGSQLPTHLPGSVCCNADASGSVSGGAPLGAQEGKLLA